MATTAAPTVITADKAIDNLGTIKTDLGNITTGMANQNITNATTAQNSAQAKTAADQQALENAQKQTEINTKAQTAATLTALKTNPSALAGNDTSTVAKTPTLTPTTTPDNKTVTVDANFANTHDMSNPAYANYVVSGPTTPQEQKDKDLADQQVATEAKLTAMENGQFALSTDEQSQVNALKQQYQQMMDDQKLANSNYEGGMTQLGIVSGRSKYAGEMEMGNIQGAINTGLKKVQKIESDMTVAVQNLTDALKSKDYDMISKQYNRINDNIKARKDAINEAKKAVNDEADKLAKKTQEANDLTKTQTESFKKAVGGMSKIYNTKTGQINDEAIKNAANYFNIDENVARGIAADYFKKENAPEVKAAQALNDKLLTTGYKTINPADVARMRAAGNDVVEAGGKAYMKPQKITTKVVTIGSGKGSYKVEQTFDQYGKKLSEKRIGTSGTSSSASTKTPSSSKPVSEAKRIASAEKEMAGAMKSVVGADGFISPQDHQQLRNQWINAGLSATTFDTKFRGYKNPNNTNYITNKQ